jgi:tRNA threonylcarbamoyladenosine biosynthesis protein TsaE
MAERLQQFLPDEAATAALAARVAAAIEGGLVVYLHGDLGAGKTSFARALLRALGVGERVKSPTYSLVEAYVLPEGRRAWHLDLYRIADPAELEWLGLDALAADALVLVEWPERGTGMLPAADLEVHLRHAGVGRDATLEGASPRGQGVLARLGG